MRKTLLLADDSITIQRVVELTFAEEPIHVEAVSDGVAAIARLDASGPDIVLADIGMPGRDGYEVALHVRRTARLAHIPVILLTGAFDPVDHARAREAGCAGVLVKPFDPQMLVARVRQLLEAPTAGENAMPERDGEAQAPPRAAAADRPADPDEYFDRLDRAFAALTTPAPGSSTSGEAPAVPSPRAEPPARSNDAGLLAGREPGELREDFADAHRASGAGEGGKPRPSGMESATPPTLGDAFAALLAMEQGRTVPDLPEPGTQASRELVEQVAARVTQEIAERVVRELAPAIVTEVVERVREEIARLQLVPPTQYDRRA